MILSSILVEIINWAILILGLIYVIGYGLCILFCPDMFKGMKGPFG